MSEISDSDYKILTGANVKWESNTHYRAMLEFAISCCEFMDNQGDLDFIITLPVNMEEFHQQLPQIKDRYILIIKSHIAHFETEPDKILTGDKADALEQTRLESLKRIGSELPEEIDNMKSSLMYESPPETISIEDLKIGDTNLQLEPAPDGDQAILKKIKDLNQQINQAKEKLSKPKQVPTIYETDYDANWKCAMEIRRMICQGEFGKPIKEVEIFKCYDWAVENCTVKGEPIEHRNKLINGYDNAKKKTKSAIIIARFEETYYD